MIDAGVGADASAEAPQGSPVEHLKPGGLGSASPDAAFNAVLAAERSLAKIAARDLPSAYGAYLDPDSRLHSDGPPPAKTKADHALALEARPRRMAMKHLGGGASDAGDIVWTYGEGRPVDGDVVRVGHYVRIWRKRPNGWRIIFDEYLPPPAVKS